MRSDRELVTSTTAVFRDALRAIKKGHKALTDDSLMPFGKHKGTKMIDLPIEYLTWLYEENQKSPSLNPNWIMVIEWMKSHRDRG